MIYAEILAAGKGTRMGNTEMPKQFLILGSKPIVIHTLEQFILNPQIDKILVCCPKDWITYMNDLLKKYLPNSNIIVVEGGNTRNETIINGCNYIKENFGIKDDDKIITHDAVRPFVSQKIITDNIKALDECDAIDTVFPASDTIIESTDNQYISNIPNRNCMYLGQTPQSFNIKKLMNIYNSLTEEDKKDLTDACKLFSLNKEKVKLVYGDCYNMKITDLHDFKISHAIIQERGQK